MWKTRFFVLVKYGKSLAYGSRERTHRVYFVTLCSKGERLSDKEMDMILKVTETKADNDGNIKYEGAPPLLCSMLSFYQCLIFSSSPRLMCPPAGRLSSSTSRVTSTLCSSQTSSRRWWPARATRTRSECRSASARRCCGCISRSLCSSTLHPPSCFLHLLRSKLANGRWLCLAFSQPPACINSTHTQSTIITPLVEGLDPFAYTPVPTHSTRLISRLFLGLIEFILP